MKTTYRIVTANGSTVVHADTLWNAIYNAGQLAGLEPSPGEVIGVFILWDGEWKEVPR